MRPVPPLVPLFPALALLAASCSAPPPELEPRALGSIERLHAHGDVLLAGQPGAADFALAKEEGVRTVVDQRKPEEDRGIEDERALVEGLGLVYANPAWNGLDELTDAILDDTRALLRTAERPILFHCKSANRVGAVWLAYRVLDEGASVERALAEARTVGLRTEVYEARVLEYVAARGTTD